MKISKWVEVGASYFYVMKNALWVLQRVPQLENAYRLDLMDTDGGSPQALFITAISLEDAQKQAEPICFNWHLHIHIEPDMPLTEFLTTPEILWFVYELYLVERTRSDFYAFLKAYKEKAKDVEKGSLFYFSSLTESFERALGERESELYRQLGKVVFNHF